MKKEINFRVGRGNVREFKKTLSPSSLASLCKWVGINQDEIKRVIKLNEQGKKK